MQNCFCIWSANAFKIDLLLTLCLPVSFKFNLFFLFFSFFSAGQIETGDDENVDESEDSDSECNGTLDLSKIKEMRLVPSDPSQCLSLSLSHAHTHATQS